MIRLFQPTHICPKCLTEYFDDIGTCDWCPLERVVPLPLPAPLPEAA